MTQNMCEWKTGFEWNLLFMLFVEKWWLESALVFFFSSLASLLSVALKFILISPMPDPDYRPMFKRSSDGYIYVLFNFVSQRIMNKK